MKPSIPSIFFIACCTLCFKGAAAQSPAFFHLTTANGLADNNVRSLAIDKRGFLWIGTAEGLSLYDGYRLTSYSKEKEPALPSNNIIHLTADSHDNIWIGTPDGIAWIDAKRIFHRVVLQDTVIHFGCRSILETQQYGPVLITSLGQYHLNRQQQWVKLSALPPQINYQHFIDASPFDSNRVAYATDSLLVIVDYTTGALSFAKPLSNMVSVCRYSNDELAVALQQGLIQIVDIHTQQVTRQYHLSRENNTLAEVALNELRMASNGALLVSTNNDGLAVITADGLITRYRHDPIISGSLGSNNISRVLSSNNGDIIIGSRIAGISTYNIYNRTAGYTSIFSNGSGGFYDNFISRIAEDSSGLLWLGGFEKVISWNRKTNIARFYDYTPQHATRSYEIRSLCIDSSGRIWAGSLGNGIALLNPVSGKFTPVVLDSNAGPAIKSKTIITLYTARSGLIWVSTVAGIYTIDPVTLSAHSLETHPGIGSIARKRINVFMEDSRGSMWLASNADGVYRYDNNTASLQHWSAANGLAADQCFGLCEDRRQQVYVGTAQGFSIIAPEGTIRTYNQQNGLRYDRCDGMLEDNKGQIWVSNIKCLVLFDPLKGSMQIFGQNSGLSPDGFRVGSLLKTRKGELIWGSRKGINYFFPEQLADFAPKLKVSIYQAVMQDKTVHLADLDQLALPFARNTIIFRFTAIDLQGSANIQYRFMLEGYDKDWQEGTDVRESRYSLLPPGNYTFKVMASADGINWISATNMAAVHIIPPVWQRWWFVLVATLGIVFITIAVVRNRYRQLKTKTEALETGQAINYFMSSMSEQQTEEDILWDVAKNCIGRLHFNNCVIYMTDEASGLLIPKAAYGPAYDGLPSLQKTQALAPGEGLAGDAAQKSSAEIVSDSRGDQRFTGIQPKGLSAIAVPVIYNEKVVGVIQCDHPKTAFFTQKHLYILRQIASLCAGKIVRARAEKEKKEAEARLTETQRKMTEVEMHALRAQMNPHFIFNCLNSINRYIVKSDQTTASLYLTKFAKLIRLILDNSNSKNVLLTNEIDALKLYIEMEALRFDKKFTYEITIAESVQPDCIEVPPLIIQPYVENAIWHGLLHKEYSGHLSICLTISGDAVLCCTIEDNGIGRKKAKELKSKTAVSRKSLGMQLTENRLQLLNKNAAMHANVDIIDLEDLSGHGTGTRVILTIPV